MTNDIFERYAALDPVKSPGMQPESNTAVAVPLLVPDGREPNMQAHQETPQQSKTSRKPRTGLLVAAAAAALVLIVGAATLLFSGSDSGTVPAVAPTSTGSTITEADAAPAVAPTTSVPSITEAEALATSDAIFVAFNAGDVDALMALFVPEAVFGDNFGIAASRAEAEMNFAWDAAQGTTITSQGCTAEASDSEAAIAVTCTFEEADALSQALPAPPVPGTVEVVVTPEGVTSILNSYGSPNFTVAGRPFDTWMKTANPDDAEKAGYGNWSTIEEAREFGELRARYATEWAAYIEENGCPFTSGC